MILPHLPRKIHSIIRPLLILLILCLYIGGTVPLFAADPPADNKVMFILFHDQNGNGRWEYGEPVPQQTMTLGYSGTDVSFSGNTVTDYVQIDTYWLNYATEFLAAGTFRLDPISIPDGYRLGSHYLTTYINWSSDYYSAEGFVVRKDDVTSVYIPLLREAPEASIAGRVVFADDTSTGIAGCQVVLLDEEGNTFLFSTATDEDGFYQFEELDYGYYRIQVTPPPAQGDVRYQLENPRSAPFQVLDGAVNPAPDFEVTRVTSVQFWMGSTLVGQLVNAPYGQTIMQPQISSSYLNFPGGYRTITGWYLDEGLTVPWNFDTSTVSGPTSLYASYRTDYNRTSSGNSSGGSSRQDTYDPPVIKTATAVINGDQVTLSVEMDGIFDVFDYLWEMKDTDGTWLQVPDARAAVCTLGGIQTGATYTFRVTVWRTYDGREVQSGEIIVRAPGGTAGEVPGDTAGESEEAYVPPSGSWDGSGAAFSVSSDVLFVGGRMDITADSAGGQWFWESGYFSVEGQDTGTPVFTAIKSGTTTVAYSHNGQTTTVTVLIHPSSLPATGQSLTLVFVSGAAGMLLLVTALMLFLRDRRRRCAT